MKKCEIKFSDICAYMALLFSVVTIVLWICNVGGFTVVSLDSFVGVIVALLAIIVTFVIGWQIYNAIDIKSKLSEIEIIKLDIAKQREEMQELAETTKHESMLIRAQEFYRSKDFINATICAMESLQHCLPLKVPSNINLVLQSVEAFASFINTPISAEESEEILKIDKFIRESNNYIFIQVKYEQIFDRFIKGIFVLPKTENKKQ